jgi:hypothetical protein
MCDDRRFRLQVRTLQLCATYQQLEAVQAFSDKQRPPDSMNLSSNVLNWG